MPLTVGSSGSAVRSLQQRLQAAGFDPGSVDGHFGPNTRAAVIAFQRAQRLEVDGVVGNQTLRAIGGESSFTPAARSSRRAGATTATALGFEHRFKEFREVDVDRLRAALPPQARGLADDFIAAGRANGLDPLVLVAISRHETGGWTSSAFRNKNNAMGVSTARGPIRFTNVGDSIAQMARGLARPTGYYRNAETLRELWGIYAPGPATGQGRQQNDPTNLNRSWGPSIVRNVQTLEAAVL